MVKYDSNQMAANNVIPGSMANTASGSPVLLPWKTESVPRLPDYAPVSAPSSGKKDAGTFICFVGTYRPILCGIADYTDYLTRVFPEDGWGVVTFDLEDYNLPPVSYADLLTKRVWYGLSRRGISAEDIAEGLPEIGASGGDSVLWFQHEFGIFPRSRRLVGTIKKLKIPVVVTLHTLHFQSSETRYGLRKNQYKLLKRLLPQVDAITVFSHGVQRAVVAAFPRYRQKVHVVQHGVHQYPGVARLSRYQAKQALHDFLVFDSDLDLPTKQSLYQQRIFLDTDTVVLGQTGFLAPQKGSEQLYRVRESLQEIVPEKRIVAVRIGSRRCADQIPYIKKLRKQTDGKNQFLLEIWLPQEKLALAQRAFDVNYYWPKDCTQSGVLAHALGTGAVIAGRDIEGVGETLKNAGAIADARQDNLLYKIRDLIKNPQMAEKIEEDALSYASMFSWKNQALRHRWLAQQTIPA